jgi:RNA polymerase sigma-70 factor (ECF subfamily)
MKLSTATESILSAFKQSAEPIGSAEQMVRNYEALLAEYAGAIRRLAGAYTATGGDQDDLFQEIAIAIWQALPRFRRECSERTFVYRIAHNRAITFVSNKRVQTTSLETEVESADFRPDPETQISQGQQRQHLLKAISCLPVPYRQVITLALEGLEYAEIADVLGIGENNVGVRLSRARKLLRDLLEKN